MRKAKCMDLTSDLTKHLTFIDDPQLANPDPWFTRTSGGAAYNIRTPRLVFILTEYSRGAKNRFREIPKGRNFFGSGGAP